MESAPRFSTVRQVEKDMRYGSEVDHHECAHSTSHVVCGLQQGSRRGRWLRIMAVSVSGLAVGRTGNGGEDERANCRAGKTSHCGEETTEQESKIVSR